MTDIGMKKKLDGKVAIITGGASSIGEATAHLFADLGAHAVVIADFQDDKGRLVAESIGLGRSTYVRCDVTDEDQVKSLLEWKAKTYGVVDIMFSNAGTASSSHKQTVVELDLSEFDRVMKVNTRGMACCVKQAARKMIEPITRGVIVCTASGLAAMSGTTLTDYIMSKHAVLGLVRSASMQLGEHGIRVNCVSPSLLATPLTAEVMGFAAPEVGEAIGPVTSLKGVVLTAAHVAESVAFLASDESAFVTGINLGVDGGAICLPDFR